MQLGYRSWAALGCLLVACGGGGSARKPEQLLCPPVTPVPAATVLQTSGCAAVVAAQREAYAQIANDPLLGDDWRREIGRCVALGNEAMNLLPLAATRQTHNSRWNDAYGERPPRVLPAAIWVKENSEHVVSETWPTRYPQDFDVQLLPGSNGTQPPLIEMRDSSTSMQAVFLGYELPFQQLAYYK